MHTNVYAVYACGCSLSVTGCSEYNNMLTNLPES